MRNGEIKNYRGCQIRKVNGKRFQVGGYLIEFNSYEAAKSAIDAAWAEDEALRNIDRYVKEELGGYM